MITLGVDPGPKGAVVCSTFNEAGRPVDMSVHDMPSSVAIIGGKDRLRVDVHGLSMLMQAYATQGVSLAVIEDLAGRDVRIPRKIGNQVVMVVQAGAFAQGFAAAMPVACAACHGLPYRMVTPSIWKPAMKVPADKEEARVAASRMMPDFAHLWPLKKHDGRAEAALLSVYAYIMLSKGIL
jgi:hypothetical protein